MLTFDLRSVLEEGEKRKAQGPHDVRVSPPLPLSVREYSAPNCCDHKQKYYHSHAGGKADASFTVALNPNATRNDSNFKDAGNEGTVRMCDGRKDPEKMKDERQRKTEKLKHM